MIPRNGMDPFGPQLLDSFHPLCPSSDLGTRPKGFQVGNNPIVLFRDRNSKVAALEDRCTHRFTPLSMGKVLENGRLECPYHGWNFGTAGDCRQPATKAENNSCAVKAYQVAERYGYLWVANAGVSPDTLPQLPRKEHDDWIAVTSYSVEYKAPFHVVLDNFSEDEHFPYVHSRFGWDREGASKVKFFCEKTDSNIFVKYHGPQRKFFGSRFAGVKKEHWIKNEWTVHFNPVWISYKVWLTNEAGVEWLSPSMNDISLFFVPHGSDKTMMHLFQFVRYRTALYRKLYPLDKSSLIKVVRDDVMNDVEFTQKLPNIPYSLEGAKLTRCDKPLVWTREMLERLYFRTASYQPGRSL